MYVTKKTQREINKIKKINKSTVHAFFGQNDQSKGAIFQFGKQCCTHGQQEEEVSKDHVELILRSTELESVQNFRFG